MTHTRSKQFQIFGIALNLGVAVGLVASEPSALASGHDKFKQ